MSDAPRCNESRENTHARFRLALGVFGFVLIWMVLLPAMGRIKPIGRMIDRHHQAGIDPSIMFYTDIEHLEYRGGMLRHKLIKDRLEQVDSKD